MRKCVIYCDYCDNSLIAEGECLIDVPTGWFVIGYRDEACSSWKIRYHFCSEGCRHKFILNGLKSSRRKEIH